MATRKSKPTPKMSPTPEKWTWQMAEEALAKNNNNRPIRWAAVDSYARQMEEGKWGTQEALAAFRGAPAPLIFDWNGDIVDAQHRLLAQVKSQTTQHWYVLRDVPPDTRAFVDTNIPRSASDILKQAGYGNYTVLQGTARWGFLLERGWANTGRIKVGPEEIRQMVDLHPDLVHSADVAGATAGVNLWSGIVGPTPLGAAHWWIAQYNDHAEADLFMDRFMALNKEPDGSAVTALWNRLSSAKKGEQFLNLRTRLAMILRAWNMDVERRWVKSIPIKSKSGEFTVPEPLKRPVSQEESFGPSAEAQANQQKESDQP
jgi:hypothetical protein